MPVETIDHGTLCRLIQAGLVSDAQIVGRSGGWAVLVKYGKTELPLTAQRSRQVRLFRRFETLVSYLKELGITRFAVDAANYEANMPSAARRPDQAQVLKRTHEAAAYDLWFRGQVQASIDDPRPSVSDDEARAQFVARKAQLRRTQ